jgi:hypothetical protein
MLLTVLAVTAPYLLAVLVAAVMWLLTTLTSQAATQPVAKLSPASSARLAVDHALAGGTRERQGRQRIAAAPSSATSGSFPTAGPSRPLAHLGAQHAGSSRK